MRVRKRVIKTYRPYGVPVFLYAIFNIAIVGCLGLFLLFPMFTYAPEGGTAITFTGLDFLRFDVRKYFSSLALPKFDDFLYYFNQATAVSGTVDNQLLKILVNIHEYIELGIGGIFGLAFVWALIEVLLSLGMMLFGKLNHPKALSVFGWLSFWFFATAIGVSFMYFFFYTQIIQQFGDTVAINLSMQCLMALCAMLGLCIVNAILWNVCFKNRIPAKKNKETGEEEEVVD